MKLFSIPVVWEVKQGLNWQLGTCSESQTQICRTETDLARRRWLKPRLRSMLSVISSLNGPGFRLFPNYDRIRWIDSAGWSGGGVMAVGMFGPKVSWSNPIMDDDLIGGKRPMGV